MCVNDCLWVLECCEIQSRFKICVRLFEFKRYELLVYNLLV